MKITATDTTGLLYLVYNAKGRNRSVYEDKFVTAVDPDGTHLLAFSFPHSDVEMRTQWLCKMKDSDFPQEIWLDVDFSALQKCTTTLEAINESR